MIPLGSSATDGPDLHHGNRALLFFESPTYGDSKGRSAATLSTGSSESSDASTTTPECESKNAKNE